MRITTVTEHDGEPALGIPYTNTDGVLFRIRIKAFRTGIILESFASTVPGEEVGVITLPHILKADDQVAYWAEPVSMCDIEEWFASDETVPLLDFLVRKYSYTAQETDNAPADDQDHEQDQQDHEPDNGPGMDQNEPELTTLQCQILQELKENGEGTVAELIDRLNMPGMQAAIRKNLHILMDEKHLIGKRSRTQNGRPAQLWGVM